MEALSPDFPQLTADGERLAAATHADPFSVLGMHAEPNEQGLSVRVFHPAALAVRVLLGQQIVPLRPLRAGFFAGLVAPNGPRIPYRLQIETAQAVLECEDPYRFGLVISTEDAISLKAGRCWHAHRVLGAHAKTLDGVPGVSFAVWAPTAKRVSVVGAWTGWEASSRPMRFRHEIGVWELFEPALPPGTAFAFDLLSADGRCLRKRDPYARALSSAAPAAALAAIPSKDAWTDGDWLAQRRAREAERKFTAIHCVSSAALGPHRDAEKALVDLIQSQGGTHLCLMQAWSPQPDAAPAASPRSWLAPAQGWGGAQGVQRLIDYAHARGLGVLIDWPIDAFCSEPEGLARFDGSALYEHANAARAAAADGNPRRFNYVRYETTNFLLSAALFWLQDLHVDGLSLRGVSEALRFRGGEGHRAVVDVAGVDFLRRLTELVAAHAPGAMVLSDDDGCWPGVTAPTWAGGLGCTSTTNGSWAGWLGDSAARTLAMLALSKPSDCLALDAWQGPHADALPTSEMRLAALVMGMLPGWKLWPDLPPSSGNDTADLRALVSALNQAQPQGSLDLLAYPNAHQDLLAFARDQAWLCAANFSENESKSLCPAPGAGQYQIIARSRYAKKDARMQISAQAAPDTPSGWMLMLDLPPRSALAAQRIGWPQ